MTAVTFFTALGVFVRITGGICLCARMMSAKKIDPKALLVPAVAAAASVLIPGNTEAGEKGSIIAAYLEVAFIWLGSLYFIKADRRKALFTACMYKMGTHLLTCLSCASLALAFRNASYLDLSDIRGSLLSLAVSILILAGCLLSFYLRKIPGRVWSRVFMFFSILMLFLINMLLKFDSPMIDKEDLYIWMYFDIGLMVGSLIVQMRKQYDTEKELADMKAEEAMMLEREYSALSSSYERNAKLFHDFRNHCGVIRNYLAGGKTEEAISYLDDLTGGSSYKGEVWTGDGTIDYLIGSKKSRAAENGISLEVNAEFPHNINIKSSDLCAILGNLLDNAIEADSKISDPSKRKIRLIIRRIGQMLVIKVENTFEQKLLSEDGEYKTTKTDGGLHGWGIKSAKTAAGKYDGTVISSVTDDVFSTVVTLSFEGIKPE